MRQSRSMHFLFVVRIFLYKFFFSYSSSTSETSSLSNSLSISISSSLEELERHFREQRPRYHASNCIGCSQQFQPTVPSATTRERKAATGRADSESTVSGFGDVATALIRLCLPGFILPVLKSVIQFRETHPIHKSIWKNSKLAMMPTLKSI